MATAARNTETRTRTETKVVEVAETYETVVLTLSLEEAKTLAVIVGKVGGTPERSRRKHSDAIAAALEAAKIPNGYDLQKGYAVGEDSSTYQTNGGGGLYFLDCKLPVDKVATPRTVCKLSDLTKGDRVEKATHAHAMYVNEGAKDLFGESEAVKGRQGTVTGFSTTEGGGVHVTWDKVYDGKSNSSVIAPQNLYKIS